MLYMRYLQISSSLEAPARPRTRAGPDPPNVAERENSNRPWGAEAIILATPRRSSGHLRDIQEGVAMRNLWRTKQAVPHQVAACWNLRETSWAEEIASVLKGFRRVATSHCHLAPKRRENVTGHARHRRLMLQAVGLPGKVCHVEN